jgi:hypothetical protein
MKKRIRRGGNCVRTERGEEKRKKNIRRGEGRRYRERI